MKMPFRPGYLCAVLLLAVACGTNPVTGKREIQFVSQAQEIQIGQQNYAPMRQSEGGDYEVLPEVSEAMVTLSQPDRSQG